MKQNLIHAGIVPGPGRALNATKSLALAGWRLYLLGMAQSAAKKKAMLLGIGLDSDGHKRVTTGPNFALVGGSEQTHEVMTEKVIKINEKLARKGKSLESVSAKEMDDIAEEVGLRRDRPEQN